MTIHSLSHRTIDTNLLAEEYRAGVVRSHLPQLSETFQRLIMNQFISDDQADASTPQDIVSSSELDSSESLLTSDATDSSVAS